MAGIVESFVESAIVALVKGICLVAPYPVRHMSAQLVRGKTRSICATEQMPFPLSCRDTEHIMRDLALTDRVRVYPSQTAMAEFACVVRHFIPMSCAHCGCRVEVDIGGRPLAQMQYCRPIDFQNRWSADDIQVALCGEVCEKAYISRQLLVGGALVTDFYNWSPYGCGMRGDNREIWWSRLDLVTKVLD